MSSDRIDAGSGTEASEAARTDSEPPATSDRSTRAGHDFEPSQLDWTGRTRHNVGGNRMRFSGTSTIALDTAWESEMPRWRQRAIQLLTTNATTVRRPAAPSPASAARGTSAPPATGTPQHLQAVVTALPDPEARRGLPEPLRTARGTCLVATQPSTSTALSLPNRRSPSAPNEPGRSYTSRCRPTLDLAVLLDLGHHPPVRGRLVSG